MPSSRVVVVGNLTRGTIVASRVRVAKSMVARARGLMFTRSLADDEGLLINPCGSIHMFFMRFALDVLYVDQFDRVVRTQRNIKPWRIGPLYTRGAKYVIELPTGTIERSAAEPGDQLQITDQTSDS